MVLFPRPVTPWTGVEFITITIFSFMIWSSGRATPTSVVVKQMVACPFVNQKRGIVLWHPSVIALRHLKTQCRIPPFCQTIAFWLWFHVFPGIVASPFCGSSGYYSRITGPLAFVYSILTFFRCATHATLPWLVRWNRLWRRWWEERTTKIWCIFTKIIVMRDGGIATKME